MQISDIQDRNGMYKYIAEHHNHPDHVIVELGVFAGQNYREIHYAAPEATLVGVDLWLRIKGVTDMLDDGSYQAMYNALKDWCSDKPKTGLMRGKTTECAKMVDDGQIDFLYIDANHSYEGCRDDIAAWASKVKKGGIISGHDYFSEYSQDGYDFGVIKAVDELRFKHFDAPFHVTPEPYAPSWFMVKTW